MVNGWSDSDGSMPVVPGVEHLAVEVDGLRFHVAVAGPTDQPAIVLLHGWPQHWWVWHDVLPALVESGWRVLAIDLRGHGWSDAPAGGYAKEQLATDVLGVLDEMGVLSFDLVGHDWGGWVAQLVALRAPRRVRRLTLLSITPLWVPRAVTARHLHRFIYQPIVALAKLGPALHRSSILWRSMQRAGMPRSAVPVFRSRFREPARAEAGSQVYRSLLREDLPSISSGTYDSQSLRMDVALLVGERDPVIRPQMFSQLGDHARRYKIVVLPGLRHFIVDEAPELIIGHLVDFHGLGSFE